MERMEGTLTDRVAITIGQALMDRADANNGFIAAGPTVHDMARLCLAALGLDDLDAAVERCARGIVQQEIDDYQWTPGDHVDGLEGLIAERVRLWRDNARCGLIAALTATEEGEP